MKCRPETHYPRAQSPEPIVFPFPQDKGTVGTRLHSYWSTDWILVWHKKCGVPVESGRDLEKEPDGDLEGGLRFVYNSTVRLLTGQRLRGRNKKKGLLYFSPPPPPSPPPRKACYRVMHRSVKGTFFDLIVA